MPRLLLLEDDAEIRGALTRALTELGHVVSSATAGPAAMSEVVNQRPDFVILGVPDLPGSDDLLLMIRSVSQVPVVVATERSDESMMVKLFELGADDYVIKPVRPAQLDARIRAVLRRTSPLGQPPSQRPDPSQQPASSASPVDAASPAADGLVVVGELRIDLARRLVTLAGAPLALTPREYDLLAYLATRVGAVVSRRELHAQVWRQAVGADNTMDVHLCWLRRKLGESAQRPRYLHTVRGVGVALMAPSG